MASYSIHICGNMQHAVDQSITYMAVNSKIQ